MGIVRMYQRQAQLLGLDLAAFCAQTGVRTEELADLRGRIDAPRFARAHAILTRCMLDSPSFTPLQPDLAKLFDDTPTVIAVLCNSASLGDALLNFVRYRRVLGELDAVECRVQDDAIELTYLPDAPGHAGLFSAVGNFTLLKGCVDHYQIDTGCAAQPSLGVHVQLAAPMGRATGVLQDALGLVLHTGTHNRLVVRGKHLWTPAQHFNPVLHSLSRRALDQDLARLDSVPSLARQVQNCIEQIWSEQLDLSMPASAGLLCAAADRLGLSRWTLRRRLEDEGQSFQALVDALRARRAQRLLGEPGPSMLDISQRLGFATQSSFNRFYRKHFDRTPMQARQDMQAA